MAPLQFSTMTLEFAAFCRAIRDPRAEALGSKSRLESWKWVAHQVRDYLQGSNGRRAALTDNISVASSKGFLRVARCRYPLYVATSMSMAMFALSQSVCARRIGRKNWDLIPTRDPQLGGSGKLRSFWGTGGPEFRSCSSSMVARSDFSDSGRGWATDVSGWRDAPNSVGR